MTYANLGNPDPDSDKDAESQVNKPMILHMIKYDSTLSSVMTSVGFNGSSTCLDHWALGQSGYVNIGVVENNSLFENNWFLNSSSQFNTVWPSCGAVENWTETGVDVNPDGSYPFSNSGINDPPWYSPGNFPNEHCKVKATANAANFSSFNTLGWDVFPWGDAERGAYWTIAHYTRTADTAWELLTGGKGVSQKQNLFCLSATATEILGKMLPAPMGPPDGPLKGIPATAIMIDEQPLGSDGNQWRLYQDNTPHDVTPRVGNNDYYEFTIGATKYKLYIQAAGSVPLQPDHVVRSANFCVGQSLNFTPIWRPSTPPFYDATAKWTLPGNFVNEQSSDCDAFYSENPSWLNLDLIYNSTLSTPCWYVDQLQGGTAKDDLSLYYQNGQTVSLGQAGMFNMYKPTAAFSVNGSTPAAVDVDGSTLMVGLSNGKGAMRFGVNVTSVFPGQIEVTQLINSWWSAILNNPPISVGGGTSGDCYLDNSETYPNTLVSLYLAGTSYVGNSALFDQPGIGLYSFQSASRNDSFKTYFRFCPVGSGSIFVTLGRANWNWYGNATETSAYTWTLTSGGITGPAYSPTTEFPYWIWVYANY